MNLENIIRYLILTGAFVSFGVAMARGADGELADRDQLIDYSFFALLNERNIFDPNRSPSRPWTPAAEAEESLSPAEEDNIDLLGTMITPDWAVAIFHGSRSEYDRKCLNGESIAGMQITRIGTDSVTLASDGSTTLSLPVGFRMQRRGGELWTLSKEAPAPPGDVGSASLPPDALENVQSNTATPPASPSSGGSDDILKKMLERRQQEINK